MCGIYGFSRLNDNTRKLAPFLAWAMEARGDDSWGCTDGDQVIKHADAITDSWELPDWEQLIVHTRSASTGSISIANAHPFAFECEDRLVIGIHNGVISNHSDLNKKYERNFSVDSQHIFAHLAEEKSLEELKGWGAVAWYQNKQLYLTRFNMWDLKAVRLTTGEVVFCSLLKPLEKAVRLCGLAIGKTYDLAEEKKYHVSRSEDRVDEIYDAGDLKFGRRSQQSFNTNDWEYMGSGVYQHKTTHAQAYTLPPDNTHTTTTRHPVYHSVDSNFCAGCATEGVDRTKHFLCHTCYAVVRDNLKTTYEQYIARTTVN